MSMLNEDLYTIKGKMSPDDLVVLKYNVLERDVEKVVKRLRLTWRYVVAERVEKTPPPPPPKPPEARCFVNGKRIYPPYAPSPRDRIIPQDTCSKIEVKESSLWCLVILGFLLGSMTTLFFIWRF